MMVQELFRTSELSRDEILKRISNAKSKEEKEMWAAYLVKVRGAIALSEVVNTKTKLKDYVLQLTDKYKIKLLGRGVGGHVFQHPTMPDVAVKVCTAKDVNYMKYAKYCMKHSLNPWVPKIMHIEDVANSSGDYHIVFMEKLRSISMREFSEFLEDVLSIDHLKPTDDEIHDAASMKHGDSDLQSLLRYLVSFDDALDFTAQNFMKRGKQIVFVDPLGTT